MQHHDGKLTTAAACTQITCDASAVPNNAKNGDELGNCSASLPAGDKCTPSCKDGYTEVDAVCSITGELTTAAACTQITCDASAVPNNAKNGDELGNCSASLPAGDKCTPSCKDGYTEVDAVCSITGELTTAAACTQITCDASAVPNNAKNGDELGNCSASLPAGDKCTPSCEDGYTEVDAVCSITGELTTAAACTQITCDASAVPDNAKNGDELGNCSASLPAGDKCTPSCEDGYTEVDAVCSITGELTTAAACTQITCDASAVPDNVEEWR